MIADTNGVNGHAGYGEVDKVPVYSIHSVPITEERKPYINDNNSRLPHAGTPKRVELPLRRLY
jgi:hypothetical protein